MSATDERPGNGRDPLQRLLGALPVAEFFARSFGRATARARSEIETSTLLSLADLDEILGSRGARHPDVRLVRADRPIDAGEYTWSDNRIDAMRAARLYCEGATLIFSGLHFEHAAIQQLCAGLSARLHGRTQANVYLTGPGRQGFEPHWDSHDVFILQISGSKRWRLYAGGPELPLGDEKFDPKVHRCGATTDEFELVAGEVVYIPRGVMHAGVAGPEGSLHITFGLLPYTWIEFLVHCLTDASERETWLREEVALFGDEGRGERFEALARARWAELGAAIDPLVVRAGRLEQVMDSQRPVARDYLLQASRELADPHQQGIAARPGLLSDSSRSSEGIRLRGGRRSILFAPEVEPMIDEFTGSGRCGPQPPTEADEISPAVRGMVMQTLVREGFATITQPRQRDTDATVQQ